MTDQGLADRAEIRARLLNAQRRMSAIVGTVGDPHLEAVWQQVQTAVSDLAGSNEKLMRYLRYLREIESDGA